MLRFSYRLPTLAHWVHRRNVSEEEKGCEETCLLGPYKTNIHVSKFASARYVKEWWLELFFYSILFVKNQKQDMADRMQNDVEHILWYSGPPETREESHLACLYSIDWSAHKTEIKRCIPAQQTVTLMMNVMNMFSNWTRKAQVKW